MCPACNSHFSTLDAELEAQLRGINGLIGVISDHRSEAKLASTTDPLDGKAVGLNAEGRAVISEPVILSESSEDVNGHQRLEMRFSDEKQIERWISQQTARGLKVKQHARAEGVQYAAQGLRIKWSFGGAEALREIGRIAMNFFAHYYPDLARSPALKPMKEYILGLGGKPVSWNVNEPGANFLEAPANPFRFGHRIVLCADTDTGRGVAYVSFFSALGFVADFGALPVLKTETIVVDIDPLAAAAPADLVESRHDRVLCPVEVRATDDDFLANLRGAVDGLLNRVYDYWWEQTESELLPAINAHSDLSRPARIEKVLEELRDHRQRVLNLLSSAIQNAARGIEEASEGALPGETAKTLAQRLRMLCAADADRASGLSVQAEGMVARVTVCLANEIAARLGDHALSGAELRSLLEGSAAQDVVISVLTEWLAQIGVTNNAAQ